MLSVDRDSGIVGPPDNLLSTRGDTPIDATVRAATGVKKRSRGIFAVGQVVKDKFSPRSYGQDTILTWSNFLDLHAWSRAVLQRRARGGG